MQSCDHRTIIRRFFEEGFTRGNTGVFDELVAPDARNADPFSGQERGPDAYGLRVAMFRTAFPDLRITVADVIDEEDRVAVRWKAQGTHQGDLAGFAPTGKSVSFGGITVFRITAHRIRESWTELDMLGILQQIGAVGRLRALSREMAAVE